MSSVTVHRNIERIDDEFISSVSKYPTGYFTDIQGRRGGLDFDIHPMFNALPVYGTAVTVKTVPDDNLSPYVALEILKPGDVLVIANGGWTGSAVVGDLIVGMYRNAGVTAIVTDGLVRDIQGLERCGVPVFARGISANSPQKFGPGEIGGEVVIGGVKICTGDLIVGDRDGIVCLPTRYFTTARAALEKVVAKECHFEEAVAQGMRSPPWVEEIVATDTVTFVD